MTAREEQNVTADRADAAHDGVGTRTRLLRCFTAGATIAEELPVRPFGKNFKSAAALVLAVIPFDQMVILLRHGAETRERAGPNGALQRAREHRRERKSR